MVLLGFVVMFGFWGGGGFFLVWIFYLFGFCVLFCLGLVGCLFDFFVSFFVGGFAFLVGGCCGVFLGLFFFGCVVFGVAFVLRGVVSVFGFWVCWSCLVICVISISRVSHEIWAHSSHPRCISSVLRSEVTGWDKLDEEGWDFKNRRMQSLHKQKSFNGARVVYLYRK